MNERIRELLIQSGLPTVLDRRQKRYEKFAESIVRECIEIVDKVYDEQTGKGGKLCSRDTPYQEIINEIEDHFGVE